MSNPPMLRTSERLAFKRCVYKWWWGWREGLVPIGQPAMALWFGTGWHIVMAHIYCGPGLIRGREPLKVWRDYVGDEIVKIRTNTHGENYQEEHYVEARTLGEIMIGNYLDLYGNDPTWHIIQAERSSQVIINRPGTKDALVKYCFTYDLVYRDLTTGHIWLGEHKTAKQISTNHLSIDDQAGSYWAIAGQELRHNGIMKPNEQIRGIMYNFARKSAGDNRPRNDQGLVTNKPAKEHYWDALAASGHIIPEKATLSQLEDLCDTFGIKVYGNPSKLQPAKLFQREAILRTAPERRTQITRIQNEALAMEQYRTGHLPLIKTPTKDCTWDCAFYHMCVLHERGNDWQEYQGELYVARDPYADHRDKVGEE